MRTTLIGIVVMVLGGIALWFGGIPYTERDQVFEFGPIQATTEVRERIDIPPLAAGLVMAFGAGLAVYGWSRK